MQPAIALFLIVSIILILGGTGRALDASAFEVQAQAVALHTTWTQMLAGGVPSTDLAGLQQEWAGAEKTTLLGVGTAFWWPGAGAMVDKWQTETDVIWSHNLRATSSSAIAADQLLHSALGSEPSSARQERLTALATASSPAEFQDLRDAWVLQAHLVPIDREIAADAGTVALLKVRGTTLGIVTTPAPAILARAGAYASLGDLDRRALAARLIRDFRSAEIVLGERLSAATVASQGFVRAAAEISLATSYGADVSAYRSQVDGERKLFSAAVSADQFKAITRNLNQIIPEVHHAGQVALNAVHVVGGVAFYYQIHPLSCEETATSMGLTHQGIHVSQDQILARLGVDNTPAQLVNGLVVRWGDPDRAFVGNVNGSENNYTGQQANPKALVRVLNSYGARIVEWSEPGVSGTAITAQEIYHQVAAGHPVVAYATWDWRWHRIYYYTSEDGNRVPLISPANDHVYLVVGVSATGVLVNDPIRGRYWVSKATFQAAYEFGMAIVLA